MGKQLEQQKIERCGEPRSQISLKEELKAELKEKNKYLLLLM